MFAWMADALETEDAEDRKLREKLTGRVGRQVEGVASVRPAIRDGWVSWAGLGYWRSSAYATVLTGAAGITATLSVAGASTCPGDGPSDPNGARGDRA